MDFINGETVSILLFFIGIYGLIAKRNIIKSIISIGIMQASIILYFISANYIAGSIPPMGDLSSGPVADPLPQALMITEIVIGVGITAASLTMFIHIFHKYGTSSWLKLRRKRLK
ncbi:sodium:proton antiporter [Alkalibaculum sp. M08DMB]|uniref:Sodium:proton antiporter n=2 Tax=Alkalibaculum sporogenes TaxID=2655001 RepID=A0A6A7K8N1_9FIRM|nr:sodium:proton antiporter [Alkalibaculum sporogenes]